MGKSWLLGTLALIVLAGPDPAGKQLADPATPREDQPCDLVRIIHDWDFSLGSHGFTTTTCDDQGVPVWEHGSTTFIPEAPGKVWGTVLDGCYPDDSGEGLVSPSFAVGEATRWVQVEHYYNIEANYDGGNLTVGGVVLPPVGGYDGPISTSIYFYAWCTSLEEGFTGHDAVWRIDCWDLGQFLGEEVQLEFDFGTDASVTYPGWYLAAVRVGSTTVPTDAVSWGRIKGLYR